MFSSNFAFKGAGSFLRYNLNFKIVNNKKETSAVHVTVDRILETQIWGGPTDFGNGLLMNIVNISKTIPSLNEEIQGSDIDQFHKELTYSYLRI